MVLRRLDLWQSKFVGRYTFGSNFCTIKISGVGKVTAIHLYFLATLGKVKRDRIISIYVTPPKEAKANTVTWLSHIGVADGYTTLPNHKNFFMWLHRQKNSKWKYEKMELRFLLNQYKHVHTTPWSCHRLL